MAPQTRQWVSTGIAWLDLLISKGLTLFKHLTPSESADYQAWRHRFLLSRLRLMLGLEFACFLTAFALDLYNAVFHLPEMKNVPDEVQEISLLMNGPVALLLLVCLALQRTRLGLRYPAVLFLCLSWSGTLVPQVVGTLKGFPFVNTDTWNLVFLAQATLIPVCWWLHLLSQLGALVYSVGVNSALGLTTYMGESIYDATFFLYIFWFCFICDLAVYLYERLQRNEFESRWELRVFLHSVSHDLRTPVMGTSIVLQNLLKKSESKVTVSRSVLERLLAGSDRQLNLINSLLEAHATEVQGIVLHHKPCQLSILVQSVLCDLEPILTKHQVILTNRVSADLPEINADSTQLWRVFSNLITNALKHNPHGIRLTLDATVEAKAIRCSVQDDGVGISAEQCQRLFELYVRGSRARYMPGLGLGLYLCRQIITAHGGKIGVTSSPGVGSTFWFTLPLHQS